MMESIDIINAIYEAVKELAEKKDKNLGIGIDRNNPIHVWTCYNGDRSASTDNYKWYSCKELITKGMPDMGKIGEIAFECYEANRPLAKIGKLPSVRDMIKALCKCPDCSIDISESSSSEIKKEYVFLVKIGAIENQADK